MERKCVTTAKFWETHNKIDDILHEVVPQIAKNVTNDLIEANLKPCIANTIIEDRDAFRLEYQLYLKMKRSLQDRADDIALLEALRRKFEKSSSFNTSCREDDFHSHHDEHQDDDAPPEGEKRVKRSKGSKRSKSAREWDAWEDENVIDEDEVIPEDETPELIADFQNVDKRVPTIFDRARMEATLRDTLSNQSRNAEEYAYHLEQSTNFMENQIYGNTKERKYVLSLHKIHAEEFTELDLEEKLNRWVRKEFKTFNEDAWITEVVRIVTNQPGGLDFMEQILVMRANDKPYSFSEADFKYLNKNDIEDLYYLCQSKEIDNLKIKLMDSLITFIRNEKRVMYLIEIVKFCDATLEKVLNEVKLRMFESQVLKKPPLLSDLDQDIMKAYEREISKHLSHRQMRRWESFVNGRPILPTMKRLGCQLTGIADPMGKPDGKSQKEETAKRRYQGELQGDSQEDKLTIAMMLLARAISQKFSTPTNNRRNITQGFNAGNAGDESNQIIQRVPRTESTPGKANRTNVVSYKDEAGNNLINEENDFMLDTSYGEDLEELTIAVMLMA
ncbi:hypothetical protein Tco_1345067 [Tanacetum coccineum]